MAAAKNSNLEDKTSGPSACVVNKQNSASILLVCEHASSHIPDRYADLGLSSEAKTSHAAWDPGAQAVSELLSAKLNAPLVLGTVSRLVYDCNRPPTSPGAIRSVSEQIVVPGNMSLTAADQIDRVEQVYKPFTRILSNTIKEFTNPPVLVTMHSFTRVYNGNRREVDIGFIHDSDERLARNMLGLSNKRLGLKYRLNEPYSKDDEVAHTLELHGTKNGLINVMIEICNDLIETPEQQNLIAETLTELLYASLDKMNKDMPSKENK